MPVPTLYRSGIDGREIYFAKPLEIVTVVPQHVEESLVPRRVEAAFPTGTRPCVELRFSDGRTLTCTGNHRILTSGGMWVTADDLRVGKSEVIVNGVTVNNLRITAQGSPIDGVGNVLGQAGPSRLRPANAGAAAFLPATGDMQFDTADLADMEATAEDEPIARHLGNRAHHLGTVVLATAAGSLQPDHWNRKLGGPVCGLRGPAWVALS